jgi:hypothetical protein
MNNCQPLTACKVNCRVVGMRMFNTFNNVIVTRQHSAMNRQLTLHADVVNNCKVYNSNSGLANDITFGKFI